LRIPVFWDTTLRLWVNYSRRFEGTCGLHIEGSFGPFFMELLTLYGENRMFLRNVGSYSVKDAVVHHRRSEFA